jgi:hypothetical protein
MNPSTNIKFTFTRNKDPDLVYNPKPTEFSLYQICQFPNQINKKYSVRRLKINQFYEIIDSKEKEYSKKKIDKFIEKTPENKYIIYPTHSIRMVAYPNPDKIIGANSDLLK